MSKLHFIMAITAAVLATVMAMNAVKETRMLLLIAVLVFQNAALLFFMVDYERLQTVQWHKREQRWPHNVA